jgi:thiol-disulfide isomerase/thioredoxin
MLEATPEPRSPGRSRRIAGLAAVGILLALLAGIGVLTADGEDTKSGTSPSKEGSGKPAATGRADAAAHNPFTHRIKAPDLTGGVSWLNTAGPLELEQLRGKFVLLDFWTYCCINCMHILPELKKLEAEFPNELVVIGVHSAKFETEQESKSINEAILRNEIQHPVVNDAKHAIWDRYGVTTWPTVLLIDPEGYVVFGLTGEFEADSVAKKLKAGIPWYRKKGVLDETPLRFDLAAYSAADTPLRYPGKVLADEASNRLFIADSNHNRIVVSRLDGTLLATIGSGQVGKTDGDFKSASFNHPQGMALVGAMLYVADTENHLLRKVDLKTERVATIAGTGQQGRGWAGVNSSHVRTPGHWGTKPRMSSLSSPWDLCVHEKDLYIAMAGNHQIWKMPLDEHEIGPYAGNGREDIVDGRLLPRVPYEDGFSSFAQPSGLATDGKWLFVADSEGSSIRMVPFKSTGEVHTLIGTSGLEYGRLFAFGDADGVGDKARLQHCLGVAYYKNHVYVADTYNNKIKELDVAQPAARTFVGSGEAGKQDDPAEFAEPAGISAAAGKLFIADTNNHVIRTVDLDDNKQVATLEIKGLEPPRVSEEDHPEVPDAKVAQVPVARLKPANGAVRLEVRLHLPDGYKINPLAPMRYTLSSAETGGVLDRSSWGKSTKLGEPEANFDVPLRLKSATGQDRVKLLVNYYYCQSDSAGLCKAGTAAWELPIALDGSAATSAVVLEHWAK